MLVGAGVLVGDRVGTASGTIVAVAASVGCAVGVKVAAVNSATISGRVVLLVRPMFAARPQDISRNMVTAPATNDKTVRLLIYSPLSSY
jgi:predicted alpha/beta hydrolase family esterase